MDTIKNNIIFFNRTSDREHLEYIKIRSIFAQLVQPGEKQHLSVYLQQAKEIKPKLDPIDHKDIIEFLDTFLKARDPKNLKSWVFLAQAQRNEKRFTQTFINVLNSDSATKAQSPNGTSWLPENVNLREMIQQIQSAKK